jgi:spermidine synthase
MNPLQRVRSIQEFHESDKDQGVQRIYLYYKSSSTHLHTEKQEVDLLESPLWGTMLFLDGVLQSTTKDELLYHTALVHPLMSVLYKKNSVLILGGGEGATAREVLRWPIESLTMVDYDEELVDHMKKHGSKWSMGAFDDPRLTVIYDDAWMYLQQAKTFDAVIVDLTDPDLKTEKWKVLLRMVMKSVEPVQGSFVINAGMYMPWKTESLKDLYMMIDDLCVRYIGYRYYVYTVYVPSFNGEWTFIVVYPKSHPILHIQKLEVIPAWIRRSIRSLDTDLLDSVIDTMPSISKITQ